VPGYPSESEFGNFLVREGIAVSAPAIGALTDYLQEAIELWEYRTGWTPFYVDPAGLDTTETFVWDQGAACHIVPPKGIISLASITVDNASLIADDYHLTNKRIGGPYQVIRLVNWITRYTSPLTVELVGKFGYTTDVPVSVKLGIFSLAMSEGGVMDQLSGNRGYGAVVREKQGPVDITWSASTVRDPVGLRSVHSSRADKAVERFKRRTA